MIPRTRWKFLWLSNLAIVVWRMGDGMIGQSCFSHKFKEFHQRSSNLLQTICKFYMNHIYDSMTLGDFLTYKYLQQILRLGTHSPALIRIRIKGQRRDVCHQRYQRPGPLLGQWLPCWIVSSGDWPGSYHIQVDTQLTSDMLTPKKASKEILSKRLVEDGIRINRII